MKDLEPKGDVKGGANGQPCNEKSKGHWNNFRNNLIRPPPGFFEIKLVHVIMLIPLAVMALSWWTSRETTSATATINQETLFKEQGQRFERLEGRIGDLEKSQKSMVDSLSPELRDLHDLELKFRIMVELVDGNKSKPELHK